MFGSSRSGGVRGGQDQFNWDDVKVDKHRENYLGESGRCTLQIPLKLHTSPRAAPSVPFAADSLITQCPGCCGRSALVPFSALRTAGPGFHRSPSGPHVASVLSETTALPHVSLPATSLPATSPQHPPQLAHKRRL